MCPSAKASGRAARSAKNISERSAPTHARIAGNRAPRVRKERFLVGITAASTGRPTQAKDFTERNGL